MISATIKFLIYFSISFVILCIPIKNKVLFYHLNKKATPYTSAIFHQIIDSIEYGLDETKVLAKKLFSNSNPRIDQVKSSSSAIQRVVKDAVFSSDEVIKEIHSKEDQKELEELLIK